MCSYKDTWAAAVGELLKYSREPKPTYASARYAVAVIKEEMTVVATLGQLPSTVKNFLPE